MQDEVRRRLTWIRLYEETHDVGLVCRRCGISGPTLRKWLRRHKRPQPPVRYSASLPGERVQMDTMKLAPGLYQYTFIDDCTRYLIARSDDRPQAAARMPPASTRPLSSTLLAQRRQDHEATR